MNAKEKEDAMTLGILQNIEDNEQVTQRHLADSLGVALGLANSYLKRCANKGLIKIQHVPANRYLYYLTPKGFAEKSRLTAQYLSYSFDFYRKASESLTEIFKNCEKDDLKRVLLFGVSELTEIASVRILEHDKLVIIGVCEPASKQKKYLKYPLWQNIEDVEDFDVCILTALDQAMPYYNFLVEKTSKERVKMPSILGINHDRN